VFGIALFGVIVHAHGLCPHVEVETVLNFVVMEWALQVVVIVEQACGGGVTLFIGEDELCGDVVPLSWRVCSGRR